MIAKFITISDNQSRNLQIWCAPRSNLTTRLFEHRYMSLEIKKMLLDRLVNLLSRGYVIPVVKYMVKCWEATDTDISLIRLVIGFGVTLHICTG